MAKTAKVDANGIRKFGILDKLSYAAGDAGCNCSFALAGTWFTLFWTEYMHIDPLFFSALLIAFKVWDAVNDTLIGSIMDASKKQYKRGKFLAYISFGSFILAAAACVCFLPIPNANMIVKCLICTLGYVAWDAAYTIVNVPYGAMLSNITAVPGERAQLGAWRNLGSMVIAMPVGVILPMILTNPDQTYKYELLFPIALVLGVVALAMFWFMIKTTVFRVDTNAVVSEEKFNLFASIGNFMKNGAALGATLIPVSMFLGQYGAATVTSVVFRSYFGQGALSGIMQLIGMLPMVLFIPFAKQITNKWGKKEAASTLAIVSVVACVLMNVVPMGPNMGGALTYVALSFLHGIGLGCGMMLANAMMADAIDYNQWKFGKREESVTYAIHSFFRKLAQGVGPSLGLVLMVMLGYDETAAVQTTEVALNMRYLMTGFTLFTSILCFVAIKFVFPLDKKTLEQMNKELGR
ncbi:MAG: MFS transporter [Oscillospiraceae bacterium]|nr:MFS transporter [Oscillospiraceae bacterium]